MRESVVVVTDPVEHRGVLSRSVSTGRWGRVAFGVRIGRHRAIYLSNCKSVVTNRSMLSVHHLVPLRGNGCLI